MRAAKGRRAEIEMANNGQGMTRPVSSIARRDGQPANAPRPASRPTRTSSQAIRIPKTAELVATHIRKMIVRGEMREGDFLQPVAQLMERYGTSRPTIREAFRILENEQLISVSRGSGAQVHTPKVDSVARYAGFALQAQGALLSDIYQARLAVEPFAVRQAAMTRKPEDVTRLREELQILEQMLERDGAGPEFREGVARLHLSIVKTAASPTLTMIAAMLEVVIERHQSKFVQRQPKFQSLTPEAGLKHNQTALKSFKKVIDLIEAKDAAGAEAQLRRHLENANIDWLYGYDRTVIVDVLD
jgi:DNA-binding FadR family transcriptional regulator